MEVGANISGIRHHGEQPAAECLSAGRVPGVFGWKVGGSGAGTAGEVGRVSPQRAGGAKIERGALRTDAPYPQQRRLPLEIGRSLVNPDIINVVELGERGGRIRVAWPLPADGRVEDQVMRRVRNAVGSGVDELIVNVPAKRIGLPLKRIDMEILGVVAVAFPGCRAGLLLAVEGVIVKRAVNNVRLVPQKLHDVDLTVPRALFRDHPLLTIRDG